MACRTRSSVDASIRLSIDARAKRHQIGSLSTLIGALIPSPLSVPPSALLPLNQPPIALCALWDALMNVEYVA